ncbi:MAG: type IV toxin-antitoxin system AbiEi family antitoxin domain-containing protein [Akkermansia sp.]|nr:type IV toxin-antitoxin system AbiEi family antitoxin domain-containing protein [Akkermansia sp.]
MMDLDASIKEYMDAQGGILTAADIQRLGYSRGMLHVYSRAGLLERYSCGVYIRPGTLADDMLYMQRKFPSLIFSHESALYLLGLTERTPFRHSVTIPSDATLPSSLAKVCTCYYMKPQLHELGLTELRTTMGNIVRGYNAERCVCDLLRSKNRVDIECYTAAIKLYFSSNEKNLHRLAEYAAKLGVMNKLIPYLEVLV